jgi:hypothetical protein
MAPSVVCSIDRRASVVQLAILLYVAAILVVARQAARHGYAVAVLRGLVFGALVSAGLGWAHAAVHDWLVRGWPRPVGLAETANMLALQVTSGALAAYALAQCAETSRARRLWLGAVGLLSITAAATLGHIAIAAVAAVLFGAFLSSEGRLRWASLAACAGALAMVVASGEIRLLPLSLSPPFLDTRRNLYAAAHTVAREVFAGAPIAGVGLECFREAWPAHDDGTRFAAWDGGTPGLVGYPLDPHSTWLGYLAEAGVFGGVALAVLVVIAVHAARDASRELRVALAFAGACSIIADVMTSRELALVIGVLSTIRVSPGMSGARRDASGAT